MLTREEVMGGLPSRRAHSLLFLATIFLHGLIIWQNPAQRISALVIGLLVLAATVVMVRRGAFAPRVVVELREGQREAGAARGMESSK